MARKKTKAQLKKEQEELTKVAQEVIDGKWNSGRERDIFLTEAGHDPREVEVEVARLRANS